PTDTALAPASLRESPAKPQAGSSRPEPARCRMPHRAHADASTSEDALRKGPLPAARPGTASSRGRCSRAVDPCSPIRFVEAEQRADRNRNLLERLRANRAADTRRERRHVSLRAQPMHREQLLLRIDAPIVRPPRALECPQLLDELVAGRARRKHLGRACRANRKR